MESDSLAIRIIEWGWLLLIAVAGDLYRRLSGVGRKADDAATRTLLLSQQNDHLEQLRAEDRRLRDEQRAEILETIKAHHESVKSDLRELRKLIKNGHG